MHKPVILVVASDSALLHLLRHELRSRYADRYKTLTAHSAASAFDLVEHCTERREPIAVYLVESAIEDGTGAEVVGELRERSGSGTRLLLAPATEETAVQAAINRGLVDRWVVHPWGATHETLYPVLDDALADWEANHPPAAAVVQLVGHRWARDSHALKDFMGRNLVPFRWLDLDRTREAQTVLDRLGSPHPELPVALLPDGTVLADPSVGELASALGMHTHPDTSYYDVAVVGGGPAGLAAALYGASEGLATVMIERDAPGGQAGTSSRIENYLGFPSGVSGADLARRALVQAERFGAEVLAPREVLSLRIDDGYKILGLDDGNSLTCRALVVASGVTYKPLHAPGLEELAGAGVYYGAATTEARDASGEHVYVVGSANSAGQGAMYFSKFAAKVTMIIRGPDLTAHMSQYLIDQIAAMPNIEILVQTRVAEAHGSDHLEALALEHVGTGEQRKVEANFLFIFIGAEPRNDWLGGAVMTDDHGYILAGDDTMTEGVFPPGWDRQRHPYHLETSVPGIFVAGDARHGSIRRVAGAVGEGSTAIQLVHRYLAEPR